MFRPFLFVGCGGSGVRTIRMIRKELATALELHGLSESDFPDSWQFLAIDVPEDEDVERDLVRYSKNDYVALSEKIGYRSTNGIDDRLAKRTATQEDFVTWRTDPTGVAVDPGIGAGQYRAVGRAIGALSMNEKLEPVLKATIAKMQSVEAGRALRKVEQALLGEIDHGAKEQEPRVFLVSSLGGGAGSGIFMDVAEAIRRSSDVNATWLQKPIGILFDPSIFSAIPGFLSGGIPANTLAATNELVAGKWNEWSNNPYLPALVGAPGDGRGPRNSYIFGRSNGNVTLESQGEAYAYAASLLSAFVLGPDLVTNFLAFPIGNWGNESQESRGLKIHDPDSNLELKPLSAIGYGQISLGRDRFRLYASERITRAAIKAANQEPTLPGADPGIKREEIVKQLVDGADRQLNSGLVLSFLERCSLNEGTEERDQVLIGLLDPNKIDDSVENSSDLIKEFIAAPVEAAKTKILGGINDKNGIWDKFNKLELIAGGAAKAEIALKLEANLSTWADAIQVKVLDVICGMVARDGLVLTRAVVAAASANEISKQFPQEMRAEATVGGRKLRSTLDGISAKIKGTKSSGSVIPEPVRRLLESATAESIGFYTYSAVRELAARALEGMARDLFIPILRALDDAIAMGKLEVDSKTFKDLSDQDPRPSLKPAPNQILLEDIGSYRATFDSLVSKIGERSVAVDSFRGAIGDGIGVTKPTTALLDQPSTRGLVPWQFTSGAKWIPEQRNAVGGVTEQGKPAEIEFKFGLGDVQARSQAWLQNDTRVAGFGPLLGETLGEWLTKASNDAEIATREDLLAQRLGEVLSLASPMTSLNTAWMDGEFSHKGNHSIQLVGVPIDPSIHASAFEKLLSVAKSNGFTESAFEKSCNPKARGTIEVVITLKPTMPSAFASLTEPIVASYKAAQISGSLVGFTRARRARPLAEFIPLPWSSQITLARGWVIGHLLGAIQVESPSAPDSDACCTIELDDSKYEYLHGFLGEGKASRNYSFLPQLPGAVEVPNGDWERAEWFGAILETTLLSEMLATHGDAEPLRAIDALLKLGISGGRTAASSDYMSLGTAIKDAPIDSLTGLLAMLENGSTGDRYADGALGLAKMRERFESITQKPQIAYQPTPRAVQISKMLVSAVKQIETALLAASKESAGGGGVF